MSDESIAEAIRRETEALEQITQRIRDLMARLNSSAGAAPPTGRVAGLKSEPRDPNDKDTLPALYATTDDEADGGDNGGD